jgi:hypothetical protein
MFDPNCQELAEHFLAERGAEVTRQLAPDLAQAIQDAVETWFSCLDMALVALASSGVIKVEQGGKV